MITKPQLDIGKWTKDGLVLLQAIADGMTAFTSNPNSGLKFLREVEAKTQLIRTQPRMGIEQTNIHGKTRHQSTVNTRVIYWSIEEDGSVLFRGIFSSALDPLTV